MKPRTKAFADKLLADPSISQTKAYIDTHDTNSPKTATVEASKLIRKPSVRIYMKKVETEAKNKIAELINHQKADIALKASQDVLDRNVGKAVQRSESSNLNLNLNVEASKELGEEFTRFIESKTRA